MVSVVDIESSNVQVPQEKLTCVGIDIDTTGRRLIDEIVQLAAYCPEAQYSQYIMPYMNLNPAARQRHQVRVITIGFFRMLKSTQTYRVLKTKSEIAALMEFLDWIENLKASDIGSNGIVLVYHEQRKFLPYMILEAFKKCNLLDRFLATVKYFANGFSLAVEKCDETIKYFTLHQLSKVLMSTDDKLLTVDSDREKSQFEGNASERAKLAFEIIQHFAKENQPSSDEPKDGEKTPDDQNTMTLSEKMCKILGKYIKPTSDNMSELCTQIQILDRQNSFRPIFLQYFKTTLYHRVKAVTFRRVLAEHGHDFESLNKIWIASNKDGLIKEIESFEDLKVEERTELVELLDSHFDPDKEPVKPNVKHPKRRSSRRNGGANRQNDENSKTGDFVSEDKQTPYSVNSSVILKPALKKIEIPQKKVDTSLEIESQMKELNVSH